MLWLLGIGLFFFIMSFPIMFDDFGTGLLGLVIGVILIAVGLFIIYRKKPEFFHFLKKKDIRAALKVFSKSRVSDQLTYSDIDKQIAEIESEHTLAKELPDLTPATYSGYNRKYHYKDVNVWVRWEYGGQYGKSCESIGMMRGDQLQLRQPKEKDQETGSIAICWKNTEIGYMKTNRMRDMVHSWQVANLPVLAFVSHVGGEEKLLVEFAFYGAPSK